MAADTGQNSAKRRSKNSHGSKTKRQKVTKGYKQSHSIGSRTSKVVTYSETIPIYQSVLAIYLENKKKKGGNAVTSTSPSSKGSLPSPSIAKSSAPSTSKISHPSSSKGLVINPKIHTNKETISLATYNYNFPIPEIHLKRTLDYPMVGGKAKLPKPCVSTKIKKDNSDGMKIRKKDGQKTTTSTGAKKINKNSPKTKDKTTTPPKPKKDAADKKNKTEKVKAPKIKKDNSFVTPSKGDESQKPGSKDCKPKLLKKDKLKLLQNTVGEKRKQSEKVKKSKPSDNKDSKPKLTANKGVKPKLTENMGDKCKASNLENINKGKKRKLNQNDEKTKTKTETKTKVRKIENTKTEKQIKKKDTKKSSKISPTQKIKQKQKKMADKKKLKADIMTNSLLDIFSLVRMKREASLNASARVNIMFEKLPTSPKTKCEPTTNHGKSEPMKDIKSNSIATEKKNSTSDGKKDKSEKTKKNVGKDDEKKKSQKDTKSKSAKDKNTNKEIKKVKDNSNAKKKEKAVVPIQGCVRRIASLNAQAIMAATKEFEAEPSERAARIDRYCVSWQCEPLATKVSSAAHWVDGLGKTCCVTQTSTCFTTATKSDSISEESKLPAITLPESEIIEERPASVVDVTTHVASNPFLQPPTQCMGSFFSQSHSCIPPCSVCCNSISSSQFKSFQLGPLNSLSSLQMMTYGHPGHPYRSAFSVPYNHTGMAVPHYGYYGNSYYQPTTGPVLQPDPCIVSHHVPIQVPQAQVKVLVHNPDSSHDHCAFTNSTVKGSKDDDLAQEPVPKRRCSSETKNKTSEKQKLDQLKLKRKYERKRSKSPSKEEPEKKIVKTVKVPEKLIIPAHGWSQCGQPELKKIPNVVEGPVRERKCFPAMKHIDGDIINIRDCVLLRSGPRKKDIPFVAKVSALWENPEDGELMMSLLWYYRPEHTEAGRKPGQLDNELFACKHRDENSLACIDDKGYVLTYNEYCRYKAEQRRIESNLPPRQNVVPKLEENSTKRQRMPPPDVNPDNVFICRQVYDFRQHRILKNPS
ncbi:uncharacterized protein LOC126822530 [Patella vulgata]|uniref:uncharacterized protein LOC126822530 n=1 Tax=Patella vulgata TaxID=6465 RepID=UPI00217FDCD1|nr:uncharacterized protein LOC126822530 [Patella vulgata]